MNPCASAVCRLCAFCACVLFKTICTARAARGYLIETWFANPHWDPSNHRANDATRRVSQVSQLKRSATLTPPVTYGCTHLFSYNTTSPYIHTHLQILIYRKHVHAFIYTHTFRYIQIRKLHVTIYTYTLIHSHKITTIKTNSYVHPLTPPYIKHIIT